jgi:ethanolamine ammonia-lyase large subunit
MTPDDLVREDFWAGLRSWTDARIAMGRAGLEDHFCGKLLGVPMGLDVCYTNHAEADQDSMDTLLTLLGVAGCNFIMGVPGADDVMLNYQSTSFHDALYARRQLGLSPAPEFAAWLERTGVFENGELKAPKHSLRIPDKERLHGLSS